MWELSSFYCVLWRYSIVVNVVFSLKKYCDLARPIVFLTFKHYSENNYDTDLIKLIPYESFQFFQE